MHILAIMSQVLNILLQIILISHPKKFFKITLYRTFICRLGHIRVYEYLTTVRI